MKRIKAGATMEHSKQEEFWNGEREMFTRVWKSWREKGNKKLGSRCIFSHESGTARTSEVQATVNENVMSSAEVEIETVEVSRGSKGMRKNKNGRFLGSETKWTEKLKRKWTRTSKQRGMKKRCLASEQKKIETRNGEKDTFTRWCGRKREPVK